MKGLFIPGITAEMFRNGNLEQIEALMSEGEIYDIEYEPKWIPTSERLPNEDGRYLVFRQKNGKIFIDGWMVGRGWLFFETVTAWMPLPEPYKGGDAE